MQLLKVKLSFETRNCKIVATEYIIIGLVFTYRLLQVIHVCVSFHNLIAISFIYFLCRFYLYGLRAEFMFKVFIYRKL